jgi:hypothetical protein
VCDDVKETLFEELWHVYQQCVVDEEHTIPYDPNITIPWPRPGAPPGEKPATFRCSQYADSFPSWCKEINEDCQNPFGSPPAGPDPYCDTFCDAYVPTPPNPQLKHDCCVAFCRANFGTCCNWLRWPIPTPEPPSAPRIPFRD